MTTILKTPTAADALRTLNATEGAEILVHTFESGARIVLVRNPYKNGIAAVVVKGANRYSVAGEQRATTNNINAMAYSAFNYAERHGL